jgi:hypothetical protein
MWTGARRYIACVVPMYACILFVGNDAEVMAPSIGSRYSGQPVTMDAVDANFDATSNGSEFLIGHRASMVLSQLGDSC